MGGGGVAHISADGNCASHYPYKVIDGHGHDRDGDGVGCESNPLWPGTSTGSSGTGPTSSTGYDRDNWSYNSSAARARLGCASSEHVDHIVALKEAYDSSASTWTAAQKRQFANDPLNQWCLLASTNISKSDHDLAEWSGGSCAQRKHIATITIQVKANYGLLIDPAERLANEAALARDCAAITVDQDSQTTTSTSSDATTAPISLRSARTGESAASVPTPSLESAPHWTAAYLFSLLTDYSVAALWKWSGVRWLAYAERDGRVIPGSTNFIIVANDSVSITHE